MAKIADIFDEIKAELPNWEEKYEDDFYQDIIDAGFNRATIKQAFVLAQIVESVGPITVRGALYRSVSAGIFSDTSDPYYRAAGNIILKLRRSGCISYSKIVDSTRRRLKPSAWSGLAEFMDCARDSYRRDLWSLQSVCVEVFVEKDAMAGVLEPITDEYDIPLNVIRGDVSETFVYNTAAIWKRITKPIHVYYLGDHDPSGLRIEACLQKKLREYSGRTNFNLKWRRLGIDNDDFNNESLLGFPIKGDRGGKAWQTKNADYLRQYGDRCVEIDALHPDVIRSRLRDAIESHIDQGAWSKLKVIEAAERDTVELAKQFVLAQKGEAA